VHHHYAQRGDDIINVRKINDGWFHGQVLSTGAQGGCSVVTLLLWY
jgi:hypothetical protein